MKFRHRLRGLTVFVRLYGGVVWRLLWIAIKRNHRYRIGSTLGVLGNAILVGVVVVGTHWLLLTVDDQRLDIVVITIGRGVKAKLLIGHGCTGEERLRTEVKTDSSDFWCCALSIATFSTKVSRPKSLKH